LTATGPTVAGGMIRGYVSVLERRGLLASVREAVPERAREVIDHPPFPLAWVETAVLAELMDATGRLHGRETVKDISLETARTKAGPILLPFMRTLLSLWGATPHSLFKHLQRLVAVQARGLNVSYAPETPSSGTVELSYPPGHAANDHVFASWEGAFHFIFDVCGVKGTVDRSEVSDGGQRARIGIRWEAGR